MGLYFTVEYDEDMEGYSMVGLITPEKDHHFVYILPPLDVSDVDVFTKSLKNEMDQILRLVRKNRTEPLV